MNYDRIYKYRFMNVDQKKKNEVWKVIAKFVYQKMERPNHLLDPAAGRCEFINAVPANDKIAVDLSEKINKYKASDVQTRVGNLFEVDFPRNYFDGIFVSNLLEHFANHQECYLFLDKMKEALKENGLIFIMGPNFKYCYKEYFDCSDHSLILTHVSVEELLYACGYKIEQVVPRFIPFSFRGRLPPSKLFTMIYLKIPFLWKIFGKQFYILARKIS